MKGESSGFTQRTGAQEAGNLCSFIPSANFYQAPPVGTRNTSWNKQTDVVPAVMPQSL